MKIAVLAPMNGRELLDLLADAHSLQEGPRAAIITLLIRELTTLGHTVEAYTLSPHASDVGTYIGDRLTLRIGTQRPRARDRALDFFKAERLHLLNMLGESEVDVVHAHWTYEYALAALASRLPSVTTVHDWAPAVLRHQLHPYRVVRLQMQHRVLRRATHLSANSPYIADKVKRWYRRDIPVVPNGISFGSMPAPRPEGSPLVLGALNVDFSDLKNVATLLRAYARVRAERPNSILRLAGNGYGDGEEAQGWARTKGLDTSVEFVGPLSYNHVPAFLRSLDLFVHPSLEESFGMVLIEAMREGTPVVAGSRSGAVPWVLDDGRAGFLADVGSAGALAHALLRIMDDTEARLQQAREGFESARRRFSISTVAASYVKQYESAIDGQGR